MLTYIALWTQCDANGIFPGARASSNSTYSHSYHTTSKPPCTSSCSIIISPITLPPMAINTAQSQHSKSISASPEKKPPKARNTQNQYNRNREATGNNRETTGCPGRGKDNRKGNKGEGGDNARAHEGDEIEKQKENPPHPNLQTARRASPTSMPSSPPIAIPTTDFENSSPGKNRPAIPTASTPHYRRSDKIHFQIPRFHPRRRRSCSVFPRPFRRLARSRHRIQPPQKDTCPKYEPPPGARQRQNGNAIETHIGNITGKIITDIT